MREAISIKKDTSPTLNRDGGGRELSKIYDSLLETPRSRTSPTEEDQSVAIQLPSAEDGDGYHRNIQIKNVSVVE